MFQSYQEVIEFLFVQFPQYQKIGGKAFKPGLDNIKKVCSFLENPQDDLNVIHVAGTNGKGSTCHYLNSILIESGCRVGLFTSPHMVDFRERILVDGEMISEQEVIDFVNENYDSFDNVNASFFEWSTSLAFYYFKKQNVDFAIIETGLGGRLDATNIVNPIVSIITSIGLDHQGYLGDTIEEIASEKAGIIKKGKPVIVSSSNSDNVLSVFKEKAISKNSELFLAEPRDMSSGFNGEFQKYNIGCALNCIDILNNSFEVEISEKSVSNGLNRVVKNGELRGRWEILQKDPKVIADIGHNDDALKHVEGSLKNESYSQLRIVWGMVEDKNVEQLKDFLPPGVEYYISQPDNFRAMPKEKLFNILENHGKCEIFENISEAYQKALNNSSSEDLVFVGGSNFVVSEIIFNFFSKKTWR